MTMTDVMENIEGADPEYINAAWAHWDSLCKPLRGFGVLEEWVARMAGMKRKVHPSYQRAAILIMGADNGVVREGVSQTGSEVSRQVLENMGERKSSVCVMSQRLNAEVFPIDIGLNEKAAHSRVIDAAVRRGTGDIMVEPAMSREEAVRAIEVGIRMVERVYAEGYDLIVTGEMGIGNTTTSAACACALFGAKPEDVTGRGAGLSSEGLIHKVEVVRQALAVNRPDPQDPLDILAKVGGLDIAGMVGCFLGAAALHLPVMVDGVISGIAACMAVMLCPAVKDYMLASHATKEPAGAMITDFLGLDPILHADMHLGEATGAAAVLPLLDMALHVYETLPSFEGGQVKAYEHLK